jgi:hypothetical protein
MHQPALETIAERLLAHARGELDDLCLPILHQVSRGKPLTMTALGASLQTFFSQSRPPRSGSRHIQVL